MGRQLLGSKEWENLTRSHFKMHVRENMETLITRPKLQSWYQVGRMN